MGTQLNKYTRFEILINVFDIRYAVQVFNKNWKISSLGFIILILGGKEWLINYIKINLIWGIIIMLAIITIPFSNFIVIKKFKIIALFECIKKKNEPKIGIIKDIQVKILENDFRITPRDSKSWRLIHIKLLIDDKYYYINGWHFSVNKKILTRSYQSQINKKMVEEEFIENWKKENRISIGSEIFFDFLTQSKYIIDIRKVSRIKQKSKVISEKNELEKGMEYFTIMFINALIVLIFIFYKISQNYW